MAAGFMAAGFEVAGFMAAGFEVAGFMAGATTLKADSGGEQNRRNYPAS